MLLTLERTGSFFDLQVGNGGDWIRWKRGKELVSESISSRKVTLCFLTPFIIRLPCMSLRTGEFLSGLSKNITLFKSLWAVGIILLSFLVLSNEFTPKYLRQF